MAAVGNWPDMGTEAASGVRDARGTCFCLGRWNNGPSRPNTRNHVHFKVFESRASGWRGEGMQEAPMVATTVRGSGSKFGVTRATVKQVIAGVAAFALTLLAIEAALLVTAALW